MWTALRARIDNRADAETMLQRYATALLTGEGDLTALRAGALAEITAGPVNTATVENSVLAIAGQKLVELFASSAAEVYSHCAARFDTAAQRFIKCANTVDVEQDPAELINGTSAERKAWADAGVEAHALETELETLTAAAALALPDLGVERAEVIISLGVAVDKHRRRELWSAFEDRTQRCGRWSALHRAGFVVRAAKLDEIAEFRRPMPKATRQVRRGIGWINEEFDPELVSA